MDTGGGGGEGGSRAYVALPKDMLEELRADHPEQRIAIIGVAAEANHEPGTVNVRGRVVTIDVGETLFGSHSFAERHGLQRDNVRRAVKRGERRRWLSRRPAWTEGAPSDARVAAPGCAPAAAPPPTILRFLKWRDILWPARRVAPPRALPAVPGTDPQRALIQPEEPVEPVNQKQGARTRAPRRTGANEWMLEVFGAAWSAARGGGPYRPSYDRDATAAKRLASYDDATREEVAVRARRYCEGADDWTLRNGGFAHFVSRWSNLDGAAPTRKRCTTAPAEDAVAFGPVTAESTFSPADAARKGAAA